MKSKLKTLKDLERPSKTRINKTLVDVTELKQEAIKWIKAITAVIDNYYEEIEGKLSIKTVTKRLRELGFYGWYTKDQPLKFSDETILLEARGAIEWIKHFFNITDKDLK